MVPPNEGDRVHADYRWIQRGTGLAQFAGSERSYLRALTSIHSSSPTTDSTVIPASSTAPAKSPGFQIENQRLPLGMSLAHPVTPAVLTDRLTRAPALPTLASSRSATAASS
jgi:hypothetical protein